MLIGQRLRQKRVWLSAQRDAYPILADYAERPELWRYINVANHGSIANQETWTERGYDSVRLLLPGSVLDTMPL